MCLRRILILAFLGCAFAQPEAEQQTVPEVVHEEVVSEGLAPEALAVCAAQGIAETNLVHWEFKKVNGALFLRLKIKDVTEFKRQVGETCLGSKGSLVHWHLHNKADFAEPVGVGNEACAPAHTGGHIDPGLACGPSSGNVLCKSMKIPPSSSLKPKVSEYTCDPEVYTQKSTFACEAGDLAGKYGALVVPPIKKNQMTFTIFAEDPNDGLNPCELEGASIVFHCGETTKRALCMKLNVQTESQNVLYISLRKFNEELLEYGQFASEVFAGSS